MGAENLAHQDLILDNPAQIELLYELRKFSIKILHVFLASATLATSPAHHNSLIFFTLTFPDGLHESQSSSQW